MAELRITDAQIADILARRAALIDEINSAPPREKQIALSKELSALEDAATMAEQLRNIRQEIAELVCLRENEDPAIRELAEDDLTRARERLPKLEEAFKVLLLPKDEADARGVILEVRAGTGGDEAALFAGDLFRMYARYAENHRWKVEVMSASESQLGGYREIVAQISGKGVYARLKFEAGTHRVQRVPETEAQGRIHTSAATVAVLPEAEEVDIEVNESDLKIDVFRASGAGGQHVNTTDSAVRITHLPTGIIVGCQEERSQHKNKAKAIKILRAKLYENERERVRSERAAARKGQVGSGDRSERIRTYNFPQGRVTDHRINLTLYSLDRVISGDSLDDIIEPLIAADQAERLAALSPGSGM
ncbi:MAG: peptide chain release factor 1 [Alphaproteobacteria bacterium]